MSTLFKHPTPNPNSLKVTTSNGPFIEAGLLSFASVIEASSHPLGAALFQIPGVDNILVMPQFLTVTKRADANWDHLWPAVEQTLTAYIRGEIR